MFPRLQRITHTLHDILRTLHNPLQPIRATLAAAMADPRQTFDDLHSSITAALLTTTRATNALCAEDLAFHRSLDARVAAALDAQQARILGLAERLLASASAAGGAGAGSGVKPLGLRDVDAVEANWRAVVDVVDGQLERADVALDEMAGVVRKTDALDVKPVEAVRVSLGSVVDADVGYSCRGIEFRRTWIYRNLSCSLSTRRKISCRSRSNLS
jgi:hypothetical protein